MTDLMHPEHNRLLMRQSHAGSHAAQFPASSCRPGPVQEKRDGLTDRCAVSYSLRRGVFGLAQPAHGIRLGPGVASQTAAHVGEEVGSA